MKVLIVFHDDKVLSGASASMLDIIDGLQNIGDLEIVACIPKGEGQLSNHLQSKGVNCFLKTYYTSRVMSEDSAFSIKAIKEWYKFILTTIQAVRARGILKGVDVVYTNSSASYFGPVLAKAGGINHIWHIREYGEKDQNVKHVFGNRLHHYFLERLSSKLILISRSLSKYYSGSIDNNKMELVYDDVAVNPITKMEYSLLSDSPLKLLVVGTICKGKGQKEIIKAVKLLLEQGIAVKLDIAGSTDSKYAKELVGFVEKTNMQEYIKFIGFNSNLNKLRIEYDIGIVASQSEAFGRVTIEGMQSGLTMIVSDAGANPELVENGVDGYVYQLGCITELADIVKNINENRQCLEDIGERAKSKAKNYTSGYSSKIINKLIVECAGCKRTR